MRLGLTTVAGHGYQRYVVPAYEFTDSTGNTWSMIALDESGLDLTAPSFGIAVW
ncbi:hypothetical protein [Microbacterium sp.]|uniref:hypothetical protein n=1 Tax=Microbacterium sp. TaxID=51671 RepID=UPI0039E62D0B